MGPGHPRLSASSEAARRASCDALHLAGEGTGLGEVQSHCSKLTAHVGASSPTHRGSPPPPPTPSRPASPAAHLARGTPRGAGRPRQISLGSSPGFSLSLALPGLPPFEISGSSRSASLDKPLAQESPSCGWLVGNPIKVWGGGPFEGAGPNWVGRGKAVPAKPRDRPLLARPFTLQSLDGCSFLPSLQQMTSGR